jgi:programmed cell death 6-interacting protein
LVSYNLPAAVEDLGGDRVPSSLLTKASEIRQLGGIEYLTRVSMELPQLLQLNKGIVDQVSLFDFFRELRVTC